MKYYLIKAPRNNDYSYENTLTVLSVLNAKKSVQASILKRFLGLASEHDYTNNLSLNIISVDAKIYFVLGCPEESASIIYNALSAQYKNADIVELKTFDTIRLTKEKIDELKVMELDYKTEYFYPINTIDDFQDVDPLSPILSLISRAGNEMTNFWFQIIATPTEGSWSTKALEYINTLQDEEGKSSNLQQTQANLIRTKIKHKGLKANIRFATNVEAFFEDAKLAFDIFANQFGNSLVKKSNKKKFYDFRKDEDIKQALVESKPTRSNSIFNVLELTTLWHIPKDSINIPNIVWGKNFLIEPPENLPVLSEKTEEERSTYTTFGKTFYKNKEQVFGISLEDRLLHTYIIGKTGSGKSWMMNNLIIDDIRKGHGVGLIDPHGEAIETVLKFIPKNRINDVLIFDPADPDYAYPLNLLDVPNKEQRDLMVSNIISIFYKLYSHSWGPRLEHILRNVLLTLVNTPNATFVDVLRILNDTQYRKKVVEQLDDVHLIRFWNREFKAMSDIQRMDAVSPINNKVGQFVASPFIRKIVAWPRSRINIEKSMNEGKILLFNLSQGKIGEDNSSLLGSAIVTQLQMAAMNRAKLNPEDVKPFFLAVDEFQNFATPSFAKILSEARKYKLGLTLVNQFISQIDPAIMHAVLGNVGTLTAFNVGATDAAILAKEFGDKVTSEDLITLAKYQMVSRVSIGKRSSEPFTCFSLPLPDNVSDNVDKIWEQSRLTYGVKVKNEFSKDDKRKPRSFDDKDMDTMDEYIPDEDYSSNETESDDNTEKSKISNTKPENNNNQSVNKQENSNSNQNNNRNRNRNRNKNRNNQNNNDNRHKNENRNEVKNNNQNQNRVQNTNKENQPSQVQKTENIQHPKQEKTDRNQQVSKNKTDIPVSNEKLEQNNTVKHDNQASPKNSDNEIPKNIKNESLVKSISPKEVHLSKSSEKEFSI